MEIHKLSCGLSLELQKGNLPSLVIRTNHSLEKKIWWVWLVVPEVPKISLQNLCKISKIVKCVD